MIEICCPNQVFFAKQPGFFSFVQQRTCLPSKPVSHYIAQKRSDDHHYDDQRIVQAKKLCSEFTHVNAGCKKQGIPWKKKSNKKPRLGKNHEEQKIQSAIVNDPFDKLLYKS